jgi:hypothetical protein
MRQVFVPEHIDDVWSILESRAGGVGFLRRRTDILVKIRSGFADPQTNRSPVHSSVSNE